MTCAIPCSMRNLPTVGSPPYKLENKFIGVMISFPFKLKESI